MSGTSLLVLLDDIATILDDVAAMTKIAARKTAGVLGDDLALNAEQVAGIRADRELPVVWAVAKGSFRNKLILVPAALAVSWAAPWLIVPLLMVGGAYLCFEGIEKLAHPFLHGAAETKAHAAELSAAMGQSELDLVAFESEKIRGAIRTDFVLSAEIVVITLGTVAAAGFLTKLAVLSGVAIIMTVGVYGLVAGIVKLDDAGVYLCGKPGAGLGTRILHLIGRSCLLGAPYLMKLLSAVGTAAMFLVGGGIIVHGIPAAHHLIEHAAQGAQAVAAIGGILEVLVSLSLNALAGIVAGALSLAGVTLAARIIKRVRPSRRAI